MEIENATESEHVRVTYKTESGEVDDVVGEVTWRCGLEGDFGIRVESAARELPVFARTYAPAVYSFDGHTRDELGTLVGVEVIDR